MIVGAGFGGLSAAKALAGTPFDVTLIDRHNYHLFQPLLYQVATAGLSPADIAVADPRHSARQQRTSRSSWPRSPASTPCDKAVIAEGRRFGFDYLVIATGREHAYFGHDDWASYAPGLKTIDDATDIRRRILLAFESAETETDPDERRRLLELRGGRRRPDRRRDGGRHRRTGEARAGRRISAPSIRATPASFWSRPDRVCWRRSIPRCPKRRGARSSSWASRCGSAPAVTECDCGRRRHRRRAHRSADHHLGRRREGIAGRPNGFGVRDRSRRTCHGQCRPVGARASRDIFVIGDIALALGQDGSPLPGVAPVAKQQGQYVARLLLARAQARRTPPFRYRDFGSLATIGRKRAVAAYWRAQVHGLFRLGAVEPRPHLLSDRLPQPAGRRHELDLELSNLSTGNAPDYRPVRLAPAGRAGYRAGSTRRCAASCAVWQTRADRRCR